MKFLSNDDLNARGLPGSKVTRWRKEKQRKFPRRTPFGDRFYAWAEPVIDAYSAALLAGHDEATATQIAERVRARLCEPEAA